MKFKLTPYSDKEVKFDDEKHLYTVDGNIKPGPSQIMGMVGLSKDVNNMPEPMRSNFIAAGNLGKVVHKWCEINDLNECEKYEEPLEKEAKYLQAWIRFKVDYKVRLLEIEKPRYSEYGDYCGIPDRVALIKGELPYIIDIKSSKSVNPNGRLQTIAYSYFFKENLKRMIVQVKSDGTYQVHDDGTFGKKFMDDAVDKDNWEAVLRVSNLVRNMK